MSTSFRSNYRATGLLGHQTDSRTLNYIPPSKVPAFVRLFDAVAAGVGSENKAHQVLGVCERTIHSARTLSRMTDKQARRILIGYKQWKAKQQ